MNIPQDNAGSNAPTADRPGRDERIASLLGSTSLLLAILLAAYYALGVSQPKVLVGLGLPNPSFSCSAGETCVSASHRLILVVVFVASIVSGVAMLIGRDRKYWSLQERIVVWVLAALSAALILTGLTTMLPTGQIWTLGRVVLLVIFTALPPAFFVLFATQKGRALRDEFRANLYRLEPAQFPRLEELYLRKFQAVYGASDQVGFVAALPRGEALLPIVLATLIIGIGWWFFYRSIAPETTETDAWLTTIWLGEVSVFTYGFLGAYFFSVSMLFRRYVQSDLKSSAYLQVCVRILATWIFALVLYVLPWEHFSADVRSQVQTMAVLAFTVGISPEIFWRMLDRFLRKVLGFTHLFEENYPLKKIRGITFWDEARLLEEGIENIQNLVTANILDLLLRTNLPAERVVNWVDQGILQLHIWEPEGSTEDGASALKLILEQHGVATASDLLRGLGHLPISPSSAIPDLHKINLSAEQQVLLDTLGGMIDGDPSMYHVKAWCLTQLELEKKLTEGTDYVILKLKRPLPEPEKPPIELKVDRAQTAASNTPAP